MNYRVKYAISGTAHNGMHHFLTVYASSMEMARSYAADHFKECKITAISD